MRQSTLLTASIATALLLAGAAEGAGAWGAGAPTSAPAAGEARAAAAKTSPRRATVDMKGIRFRPRTVTIRRGGKVMWVNREFPKHTARFKGKLGNTGTIEENEKRSLTLRKVGRHSYVCEFHPTMNGTVVVRAR